MPFLDFPLSNTAPFQVLDCVENVPPDILLGVWKELSAASEQLRLLMTTRSLFATQDLEDVATTVELRRLSRRASVDLLRNIVKVSPFHFSHAARRHARHLCILSPQPPLSKSFRIEISAIKNSTMCSTSSGDIPWLCALSVAA